MDFMAGQGHEPTRDLQLATRGASKPGDPRSSEKGGSERVSRGCQNVPKFPIIIIPAETIPHGLPLPCATDT